MNAHYANGRGGISQWSCPDPMKLGAEALA